MAFVACVLMIACEDDDVHYPAYVTDLIEAYTNSDGMVSNIRLDNGRTFRVSQSIKANAADSTLRCLSTYVENGEDVRLYSITHIFSAHPVKWTEVKERHDDPVKFVSAWRSDRYVNLRIGVMTTKQSGHSFAFCEDSVTTDHDGKTKAYITLLHRQPDDDAESFTEEHFLSIPRAHYEECDSFVVSMTTYDGKITIVK